MPIDASIYQGIKQYEAPDQLGEMAKILQLKGLQSDQQLGQMKMDEYKRGVEQNNTLRSLLASGMSPDKAALQVGDIKTATEYQKAGSEMTAKRASAAKDLMAVQKQIANKVFANPTQENAVNAIGEMGYYAKQLGFGDFDFSKDLEEIQKRQTPELIKQWAAGHALEAEKGLEHFVTNDTGGSSNIVGINPLTGAVRTVSSTKKTATPGELLADQRARDQAAQQGWQYDTERGIAVNAKTGESKPIMQNGAPLAPKDKPMPEAALKQVVGTRNLQDAVDNYLQKLNSFSIEGMVNPDSRAAMGNAYNNMMLQAKEAYNLGVLNGPDYDILQSVVKDPTKSTSVFTSNQAMADQAKELKRIAGGIEKTVNEVHGKSYKPRDSGQSAAPSTQDQQALQWANANPADPRAAAIKKRLGM